MKKSWIAFKFNTWFFFHAIPYLWKVQKDEKWVPLRTSPKGRNYGEWIVFKLTFWQKLENLQDLYKEYYPYQLRLMTSNELDYYIKEMKQSIDQLDGRYR